ncbi:hypothetical protein J0A68_19210 [Algoriphagus sp. H41]|uniref:Uncharacterized protein n=1 Tax=Algoriphagus oliviformis TaxID=2811231 RepID=A0ABS3C7Y9_9BACT|nr:DUF6520 family protein [Algoriphagus oliviformis]MBN7813092.1 hypothetical protein [Algoriphagus oliviformis]
MKRVFKMLPALALVLAAGLAFGFNAPEILAKKTATKIWTPGGPLPHGYRDVTDVVNNGNYDCDSQSAECIVEFSNDDPATGIKNVLDTGVYSQTM